MIYRYNILFISMISVLLMTFQAKAADLVFHFDFKDAATKQVITDLTGKVKCYSKHKVFVEQENALRLADGAQIYIPSKDLPPLTDKFSFNIWLVKLRRGEVGPLFFKGLHPNPIQFLIEVPHMYPGFVYKNDNVTTSWKGIEAFGSVGAHKVEYRHPEYLINGIKPEVTPGLWKMLSVVFDMGSIYIYLDGELVIKKEVSKPERLEACDFRLYLGAERIPSSEMNYLTANMLVNDWRLYNGALNVSEIKKIYESERPKYPSKSLMKDSWTAYPKCHTYMEKSLKGYDPEFKTKLPLTIEYEKNLPAQLPSGKGHTVSKLKLANNGTMGLFIDDKEYFPMLYASSTEGNSTGYSRNPANFGIRNFAAAKLSLFAVEVHTWIDMINVWKGRKNYDFSLFDKAIRDALIASPTGKLQVCFFPEPIAWFQGAHNRELERNYPDMTSKRELGLLYQGPYGSEVWVECSSELLGDLVRYIEDQDYADRIYDYKLFCGGGGEWYWPGCFMESTPGYSDATRDSFRVWLRKKYSNDGALQKAWDQDSVTLETALVPSPEFRWSSELFNFRDQFKARSVFDFREYMGDITYDNIKQNTKAIKEACNYKKLLTIYYGYALFFNNTQNTTQYISGVQMLSKVLDLPTVDNIATPIDYNERLPGEPGGNLNPFNASALLHKKLIWQENDIRTHLFAENMYGRTNNLTETLTVIRRGFGHALTSNMGFWLYAHPANYVYNDNDIMLEVKKITEVATEAMPKNRSSIAEVAFIFDEKSTLYTAYQKNPFINDHAWRVYQNAFRMGAPFDAYLIDDIDNPSMRDYKLYIFMNTYYTDPEIRKKIAAKIRKKNAVAVWCYAPGFIEEKGFSEKTMFDLTGLTLRHEMKQLPMQLQITNKDHLLTRYAGKMERYDVGPVIWSDDPSAQVLGSAGGKDALVVKKFENWTSVYTLMPLNKELLAGLCEFAGVHRFSTDYDVLTVNKSYIMLHVSKGGDKTIRLPNKAKVTDVFSKQVIGEGVNSFTVKDIPAQATRIYEID